MLSKFNRFRYSNFQNMATIKFLLQGKSEKTPIYLRFSIGRGNTPKRKTGLFINPKDWSAVTNLPVNNTAHNKKVRSSLKKLDTHISDRYVIDYSQGITINGDWLKDEIDRFFNQGKQQTNLNRVTEYIEFFLTTVDLKENSKGGLGLSKSRVNDYKTLLRLMQEFEGKTPILIKNINIAFKSKFLKWMITEKNYSTGYTGRMLGNLKTVCLDAELNGIEAHPQLKKVSGFRVKNEFVIYLSLAELDIIANTELPQPYLENARKWLLLGCNLGQRGTDLLNLTDENFITRKGLRVIELEQGKTGKNVTIPVLPETEKILKNGLPHKISLQKFNNYIKEVAKIAGLTAMTQGKKLDPKTNRHKQGVYPKWELVTSHICRRSFATNLHGVLPTPLIMQITAHSSEKVFYGYIGKSSLDYAQQIANFYTQLALKEKREPRLNIVQDNEKVVNQ